jgi:tryptophan halogenase
MNDVKNVTIVGGGSAGWMTATAFVRMAPHINVTLIESANVPVVGVGESTLTGINNWLIACGITDEDWMAECGATYKTSIKFTNWTKEKGVAFQYPFGSPDYENRTVEGLKDYHILNHYDPEQFPLSKYAEYWHPSLHWYNNNKMFGPKNAPDGFNFDLHTAYHMDAILFGQWLKNNVCLKEPNFTYITDDVLHVTKNEGGEIDSLVTQDSGNLEADLYIDCTGFRSFLLGGQMGEEFESYEDTLMNDFAIAAQIPYIDKELEMESVTNCTAIESGWCWNTPLFNRIGTGYVYSSRFSTPEEAEADFRKHLASDAMVIADKDRADKAEMRHIPMRHGRHKRSWVKNVVAIGLSHAFIEPLESTGLMFVHDNILELINKLCARDGVINRMDISNFNCMTSDRLHQMKHFIELHYSYSTRKDTPYWKHVTNDINYSPLIEDSHMLYKAPASDLIVVNLLSSVGHKMDPNLENNFPERSGIPYILSGHGVNFISKREVATLPDDVQKIGDELSKLYEKKTRKISNGFKYEKSHYEYLKSTLYKGKT